MKKLLLVALLTTAMSLFGATYDKDAPDKSMSSAILSALGQPHFRDTLVNMADRYAQLKLSSTEVLALNGSPKLIVASPGAGYTLVPTALYATLDYNAATYASGGALEVNYGPSGARAIALPASAYTSANDENQFQVATVGAGDLSGVDNYGLWVQADSSNPTTGDSELFVRVYYKVVPTLLTD